VAGITEVNDARSGFGSDAARIDTIDPRALLGPGIDDFGRTFLITRRLIERGVRFVQLDSGGGHMEDTWDGHSNCVTNMQLHAGETEQPIAALITGPSGKAWLLASRSGDVFFGDDDGEHQFPFLFRNRFQKFRQWIGLDHVGAGQV